MDKKTSKILITGAHGFLGSFVVDELIKKNYKLENLYLPKHADYDLTIEVDVKKMFDTLKPDVVIHIAADIGGIGYSKKNPAKQLYNNLMMNTLVQHYSYRSGVDKFVGIGTVCSYPKYTEVPFREEHIWNGYPEETNASYGLSKKMMMEQSQAYRVQYGFNAIHLLMINLYGPRDNFNIETSHVIPALIQKIDHAKKQNEKQIVIWGDGSPTREFIYVEDAARAIVLAMEAYDGAAPINIGTGKEISILDLVSTISKLMDFKGDIVCDTSKPNGQPKRKLDVSKAYEAFNFKANIDFEEGLKRTIQWYFSNQNKLKH